MMKLFLFFSFLILLCSFVSALEGADYVDLMFNDSFDYIGVAYGTAEWKVLGACGKMPNPFSSGDLFEGGSFAYNDTLCGANPSKTIEKNFNVNITGGIQMVSFNMSYLNTSEGVNPAFRVFLGDSVTSDRIMIDNDGVHMEFTNWVGATSCNFARTKGRIGETGEFTIIMDFDNGLYSAYWNESSLGCIDIQLFNDSIPHNISRVKIVALNLNGDQTIKQSMYLDDLRVGSATFTAAFECNEPSLFCDDFNYDASLLTRDWLPYTSGFLIDSSISPTDNALLLDGTGEIFPFHNIDDFTVIYPSGPGTVIVSSIFSPIFSSSFIVNITGIDLDEAFKYSVSDIDSLKVYDLIARVEPDGESISWFVRRSLTGVDQWTAICPNCTNVNEISKIKINTFFDDHPDYPFNSSIGESHLSVIIDDLSFGIFNFTNPEALNQFGHFIVKQSNASFIVDDYLVMVGSDPFIITSTEYYTPLFTEEDFDIISRGKGSEDLATAVSTIWEQFGIISLTSRVITALFLMMLLALVLIGVGMNMGIMISPIHIVIVEVIFMILLVILQLLPAWIPIVLGIIGAGVTAFIMSRTTNNGG